MSTKIWDGTVGAWIADTLCDRCSSRTRCVALFHNAPIDLCLECFSELTTQVYLTMLAPAGEKPPLQLPSPVLADVDFIARLADAWDSRGTFTFDPADRERYALLEIAGLPRSRFQRRWMEFTADERRALLLAARRAIEFGRQCAWVLGEGQGARF